MSRISRGVKRVETLDNKCRFFYFVDCAGNSAYTTLNWGAGDFRELTLDVLKIGKGHFLKVSELLLSPGIGY